MRYTGEKFVFRPFNPFERRYFLINHQQTTALPLRTADGHRAPQKNREAAITLLKDGFDDLEEDFGEEQFFAAARATYWKAADGSETRALSSLLIQRLEF